MDWLFTATYLVVLSLKNRGMAFKVKLILRCVLTCMQQ